MNRIVHTAGLCLAGLMTAVAAAQEPAVPADGEVPEAVKPAMEQYNRGLELLGKGRSEDALAAFRAALAAASEAGGENGRTIAASAALTAANIRVLQGGAAEGHEPASALPGADSPGAGVRPA